MKTDNVVNDYLTQHGIDYRASYVRLTTRDQDWQCDEWTVTLTRNGRAFQTAYYCGLGHRKRKPTSLRGRASLAYAEWERTGIPHPPSAASVLHSVLLDASAADGTFENFCRDSGYDTDSRKALEVYLQCQTLGAQLSAVLGHPHMDALRELLAEY